MAFYTIIPFFGNCHGNLKFLLVVLTFSGISYIIEYSNLSLIEFNLYKGVAVRVMGNGAFQRVSGRCDDTGVSHEVQLSALTGKPVFRKVSAGAGLRYRPRKFPESGTTHSLRLFCDMARECVFILQEGFILV